MKAPWSGRPGMAEHGLPGDAWGAPVEQPIVRGSHDLPRDFILLDEATLLPAPGSKYETITNELDRPASLFGAAMANRIRGLVGPLGVAKGQKVTSIRYSDQYVRSPLVAKLFIDTVADLVKGATHTIELLTLPPAPRNNMQYRVFDDWARWSRKPSNLSVLTRRRKV